MKKFLFSLATLFVVALTAVLFTSCDKEDGTSDVLLYQYGTSDISLKNTDTEVWNQIEAAYKTELQKISGASINSQYLEISGGSASKYDKLIKQACETAEATINSTVTIPSGLSLTYRVKRVALDDSNDVVIYSKSWGAQ